MADSTLRSSLEKALQTDLKIHPKGCQVQDSVRELLALIDQFPSKAATPTTEIKRV